MRTKKAFRKMVIVGDDKGNLVDDMDIADKENLVDDTINGNKENSDDGNDEVIEGFERVEISENRLNTDINHTDDASKEKESEHNTNDTDSTIETTRLTEILSDDPLPLSFVNDQNEQSISPVFENGNEMTSNLAVSENEQGKKRPFEEVDDLFEDDESTEEANDEYEHKYLKLKKKCISLEKENKYFRTHWMPRPTDTAAVEYFIKAADTLRPIENIPNKDQDKVVLNFVQTLGIRKEQLLQCNKNTATATAISLLRLICPKPEINFRLSQVENSVVDNIISYVKHIHPYDTTKNSAMRKAMGNVFCSSAYKRKKKRTE